MLYAVYCMFFYMKLKTFESEMKFIEAVSNFIAINLKNKNSASIALSGGSTPAPIYRELSKIHGLDFSKIEIFQVDERYIDKNSEDSNYHLINDNLIKNLKTAPKAFHYFDTDLKIEDAVAKYGQEIKKTANHGFDICILGIGEDGHTASIFPNTQAIEENIKLAVHTQTDRFPIKDRLTITFPVILKSKKIIILLKGKNKENTLNELLNGYKSITEFPAKKLLTQNNLYIYFLK